MLILLGILASKLLRPLGKGLAVVVSLSILGNILYLTVEPVFGFVGEYWPVAVGLTTVLLFASAELGKLRYAMKRSHYGFMVQTKGADSAGPQLDEDTWGSYFID